MTSLFKYFFKYLFAVILITGFSAVYASTSNGTINSSNHSALLCKNDICTITTTINFLTTNGADIYITDSAITGNAWSEDMGWINLNPAQSGVTNTINGILGGYAWGENAGWINFNPSNGGVTINNSGQFAGWAWAQNYGWIKFDCSVANACVETDWRPIDARGSGGGHAIPPPIPPPIPPIIIPPIIPVVPPVVPLVIEPIIPPIEPTTPIINTEIPTNPTENTFTENTENNNQPSNNNFNFSNGLAITQAVVAQIAENVKESFNKTADISKEAITKISEIIKTPEGNITSKVITTTGVVTGTSISIATALFANPLSFSELFLIPFRIWSLLLAALGIKKRNRPWGTVYDSITKQPIDPAYVILQDLNGNEVATSITDLDGRYGFLVPAGQYRMIANKTNYEFPSKKLNGKTQDELYHDLYFNEIIDVSEGGVIAKNIPMDPLKFDWNEFAKKNKNLMKFFLKRDLWIARISDFFFYLGLIITIISTMAIPVFYNIAILVIYLILFILKRTILKPRAFGYIKQKETKNPLSFAIIRVFFAGSDNEVIHKITDKTGKYYCLISNGKYYTKIENKNLDESYSLIHTSEPIEIKNGYINKKFEV